LLQKKVKSFSPHKNESLSFESSNNKKDNQEESEESFERELRICTLHVVPMWEWKPHYNFELNGYSQVKVRLVLVGFG